MGKHDRKAFARPDNGDQHRCSCRPGWCVVTAPRVPRILLEMSAEFAGTLILIMFGVGVTAQVVAAQLGNHDSISWAWGLGVTFGVYTAARISGAHLNPAVTLALATFRRFPWRSVLPYVV